MTARSTRKKFYVYTLSRPDGSVFYVGKGTGSRISAHEREARTACECHKCRVIRKIWKDGGVCVRAFVFDSDIESEALAHEVKLIAQYGRENLTNLTDGGEGKPGWIPTPDQRQRMTEHCQALARQPEQREKRRRSAQRLMDDPDHYQRAVQAITRPENKAKNRERMLRLHREHPEMRRAGGEALRALAQDPKERQRRSEWAKNRPPEVRERQSKTLKATQARLKIDHQVEAGQILFDLGGEENIKS